ncbi:MAG TPA: hypothetical protein PKN36_00090 [bacterium]|nr:hypothetical protein [bacterium]
MDIFEEDMPCPEKNENAMNRQYFTIAGITVCVESDTDSGRIEFSKKFNSFRVAGKGEDNVVLRHYFNMPEIKGRYLGKEVYRKVPWAVYRKGREWIYLGITRQESNERLFRIAVFNDGYTCGKIYDNPIEKETLYEGGKSALSFFPTDQVWLAPLLADRKAFFLHSSAAILNGQGLIFVGHSEAGKSTTLKMLKGKAEILCDDRNILRRWDDGWRVHGTWSHGELPYVSSSSAKLTAVLILKQDRCNKIVRMIDRREIWKKLLVTLIKPMVTAEWWMKELDALELLVKEVPVLTMHFDKSGEIVEELEKLDKKK